MDHLKACRSFFAINRRMLPIKLHFILYSFGASCVMTFFSLIAKNVGMSPTALAIISTISPFVTVFSNPSLGWIADKLEKVTPVLIGLVIIQTPLYMGTVFVPPLESGTLPISGKLTCSSNSSCSVAFLNTSTLASNNTNFQCNFNSSECDFFQCDFFPVNVTSFNATLYAMDINLETVGTSNTSSVFLQINDVSLSEVTANCELDENSTCEVLCSSIETRKNSEFLSYQFWTLLLLMVPSVVLTNATISIGDAGCFEALEGKVNSFGKHRVWMSIGWGFGTLFSGYLLDLTNYNNDGRIDFRCSAYIALTLMVFDIIALTRTNMKKPKASQHIFKDICNLFTKLHTIFFTAVVLFIGMFTAALQRFQFWYLDDLGASKLLLGLSDLIVCTIAEGPFIFLSGWIIKKIGRDNCMIVALSSLAAGFLSISFIDNPWWIILINLFQGPTYGLFFIAMSSYGKLAAPSGTEATTQTFLGSMYHGLGVGTGNLLVGIAFDLYGGRTTYRVSGFLCIGTAILYKLLTYFVAGESTVISTDRKEGDVEMK